VISTNYEDNDVLIEAIVPASIAGKLQAFSSNDSVSLS